MHSWFQNIVAALVVSIVALPLGASFGILSGRGAFAGMIASVVIALVATTLGGTKVKCSGPTAPMSAVALTVFLYATSSEYGASISPDHFINATFVLAGIVIFLFGVLRLGKYIRYIPNVVISGFMNGIALLIWRDQLESLLGINDHAPLVGGTVLNVIVVIATLCIIFLVPLLLKKISPKYAHYLPSTLVALVLVSVLVYIMNLNIAMVSMEATFHNFNDVQQYVSGNIPVGINWSHIQLMLPFALQLAVLCYLDTLLTSRIIDQMTETTTKPNQELMAQGLANGLAGMIGGIPGAQATIRSVLIIKEGATKRWSAIMVGVFMIVLLVLFQDIIQFIPRAAFIAILFKVGLDVFDWTPLRLYFKELFYQTSDLLHHWMSRHDDDPIFVTNREMMMIVGTTVMTLVWDLNAAIFIFTCAFYLLNYFIMPKNPMRDLKPMVETQVFVEED